MATGTIGGRATQRGDRAGAGGRGTLRVDRCPLRRDQSEGPCNLPRARQVEGTRALIVRKYGRVEAARRCFPWGPGKNGPTPCARSSRPLASANKAQGKPALWLGRRRQGTVTAFSLVLLKDQCRGRGEGAAGTVRFFLRYFYRTLKLFSLLEKLSELNVRAHWRGLSVSCAARGSERLVSWASRARMGSASLAKPETASKSVRTVP
jgi:hypothetical protein